jgi:hypothetical protein
MVFGVALQCMVTNERLSDDLAESALALPVSAAKIDYRLLSARGN